MSKKALVIAALGTGLLFSSFGFGDCGPWGWLAVGAGALVLLGGGLGALTGTTTTT